MKSRESKNAFYCLFFCSVDVERRLEPLGDYSYLTLEQHRKIEKMYAAGMRVVDIASSLKRSPAAIYEELKRGNTGKLDRYSRPQYRAEIAQATAQKNFRRRGNRRSVSCE